MKDIVDRLHQLGNVTAEDAVGEIERLRFALRTVLGDSTHGQNMNWTERCKIGRDALAGEHAASDPKGNMTPEEIRHALKHHLYSPDADDDRVERSTVDRRAE